MLLVSSSGRSFLDFCSSENALQATPAAHVQQGLEEWSSANLGAMIILGGVQKIVGFSMI
jgi:hypothetical protein